ncbi:hypothetical protein [Flavobacterium sp. KJJ]|uniref:hypothetical protein n=1 Tax=Flavobacterium sp. KJJ TaxID=1270193 RepID=UPI00049393C6|nr:hypothetical protein [Flavobacterium sp. KJJ]
MAQSQRHLRSVGDERLCGAGENLSRNFAKGASGEVNFFTTVAGPRATSIWITTERPILETNGVNIITNIIN